MSSKEKIRKMLPKTYPRRVVAEDIDTALSYFKSLTPAMNKYVYNDGVTKDLMCLSGTIRTIYNGKAYNTPLSVWLEESYPQSAPIVFVQPTKEMMIVKRTFVSSNGEVQLPYLEEWKQGECDLLSLLQLIAAMFGEYPPVCIKPYPEPEQAPCWLQFHREHDIYSRPDGSSYLSLPKDDDQPFPQHHETNC
ncbi:tumor susceptibility gene 101 protein [Periophthalmus magnuspinnatus]|uniref:tumor susceptibility gene 101 protein n=1 Tax=Periophthalmus magnuspinnatus TaxID=409849 RepID=UPI00145BB4A0|nr:tumor susceptibility gene 101 protein [Periophthalmus magnuspinnatus]